MPLGYSIWEMIIWIVVFVLIWKLIDWLFEQFSFRRKKHHHRFHRYKKPFYKKGLFWIIVLLFLIAYVFANPYTFDNLQEKITGSKSENSISERDARSETTKEDIVSKCRKEFNYYKDISEKKHGTSIKISDIEKINNLESANDFLKTWSFLGRQKLVSDYQFEPSLFGLDMPEFPIVLVGASVRHNTGDQGPVVVGCDNQGKLTEQSKNLLIGSF